MIVRASTRPTVTKTRISFCSFTRTFEPKRRGPIHHQSRSHGMPLSICVSTVRERPPITAVVPLAMLNAVTRRCTSMIGYLAA